MVPAICPVTAFLRPFVSSTSVALVGSVTVVEIFLCTQTQPYLMSLLDLVQLKVLHLDLSMSPVYRVSRSYRQEYFLRSHAQSHFLTHVSLRCLFLQAGVVICAVTRLLGAELFSRLTCPLISAAKGSTTEPTLGLLAFAPRPGTRGAPSEPTPPECSRGGHARGLGAQPPELSKPAYTAGARMPSKHTYAHTYSCVTEHPPQALGTERRTPAIKLSLFLYISYSGEGTDGDN